MTPSTQPRRFGVQPGGEGAWVTLYPSAPSSTLTWIRSLPWAWPERLGLVLQQRYQVRLSWPANVRRTTDQIPASFSIEVSSPHAVAHTKRDARPCTRLQARVRADITGVRLSPTPYRPSPLFAMIEAALGWAGPCPTDTHAPIPVDVTFEHVYLGFLPSSAVPMLAYMVAAVLLARYVAPIFLRIQGAVSRPRTPPAPKGARYPL